MRGIQLMRSWRWKIWLCSACYSFTLHRHTMFTVALMWIYSSCIFNMHTVLTVIQEPIKPCWTNMLLLLNYRQNTICNTNASQQQLCSSSWSNTPSSLFVVQPISALQCIKDLSLFVTLLSGEAILANLASRHTTQYLCLMVSALKRAAAALTTNNS